jgi:hypothetical protein
MQPISTRQTHLKRQARRPWQKATETRQTHLDLDAANLDAGNASQKAGMSSTQRRNLICCRAAEN